MQLRQIIRIYFRKISLAFAIGISVFLILGSLRQNIDGEKNAEIDASYTLATYVAAPIIGLDIYIKKGMNRSTYIGEHAFKDYYDYARIFGVSYKRSQFHKDDFYAGKGSSNVYTGFYYWLSDFSFFGACIYAFVLGLIVGNFYYKKSNLCSIAESYFRSYLYFSILMMFYDDQFNGILSVIMLCQILFLTIVQKKYLVAKT